MANPISGLGNIQSLPPELTFGNSESSAPSKGLSFQKLLLNSVSGFNEQQQSMQGAIEESLAGGDVSQIQVFTDMKKADLSLKMMVQIRNRLLEAFKEIQDLRM